MEEPVFTEDALKRLHNNTRTTINKLDNKSSEAARRNDGDAWLKHQREAIHTIERHIQHFVDHGHYYADVEENSIKPWRENLQVRQALVLPEILKRRAPPLRELSDSDVKSARDLAERGAQFGEGGGRRKTRRKKRKRRRKTRRKRQTKRRRRRKTRRKRQTKRRRRRKTRRKRQIKRRR